MPTDFDTRAATWDDDPSKIERAGFVADAIRDAVATGGTTRLLEYGAGTGLIAQALADHVGPITLADVSQGMRQVMQDKVASGALPGSASVWELDLATDAPPDERFDLIVTVLTLHHIHDTARVLNGFARSLDEGGHVCIVDLDEEDGSFHDSDSGFDGHHGFSREALTEWLTAAGFVDVAIAPCYEDVKDGRSYPMFLAVARRADG